MQPCKNCIKQSTQCHYASVTRRTRRTAVEINRQLMERLQRTEALLEAAGIGVSANNVSNGGQREGNAIPVNGQELHKIHTTDVEDDRDRLSTGRSPPYELDEVLPTLYTRNIESSLARSYTNVSESEQKPQQAISPIFNTDGVCTAPLSPSFTSTTAGQCSVHPISQVKNPTLHSSAMQVQSPALTSPPCDESSAEVEVHGSGSYLSICSDAVIEWVTERTGELGVSVSANSLSSVVTRSLKLHSPLDRIRMPEPDPNTAWKYTKAYFEEALYAALNTIHRTTFETRLRLSIEFGTVFDSDPAWYALRNVVYAFGSRIVIYKQSMLGNWAEAQKESWKYFENALSVHTELAYAASNVTAAQALLAMAYYVEGAGSPKLEYMLVSTALRLAQSKGLHMQPAPNWKISEFEINNRNWLFWSIYSYEKMISFRSGRPSAIDDDDISCQIPTVSPEGNPAKAEAFKQLVLHAQISSSIVKNLITAKARQKTPDQIVKTVQSLDRRLRRWYSDIPPDFKSDIPLRTTGLPDGIRIEHLAYSFFSYYGSLAAIHSVLAWPWNVPGLEKENDDAIREQIDASSKVVADASRNIILATKSITVDSEAPTWMTFHFPLVGMINLFLYILKFPDLESVPTDIGLIDMVAGYFGYREFCTSSEISLPFVRDIANWARAAVAKARGKQTASVPNTPLPANTPNTAIPDVDFYHEFGDLSEADLSFDFWPSFVPSLAHISSMGINGFLGGPEEF